MYRCNILTCTTFQPTLANVNTYQISRQTLGYVGCTQIVILFMYALYVYWKMGAYHSVTPDLMVYIVMVEYLQQELNLKISRFKKTHMLYVRTVSIWAYFCQGLSCLNCNILLFQEEFYIEFCYCVKRVPKQNSHFRLLKIYTTCLSCCI